MINRIVNILVLKWISTRFKKQNGSLADIKVDIMFKFIGDERAEVPAHDAVPSPIIVMFALVLKLLLYTFM